MGREFQGRMRLKKKKKTPGEYTSQLMEGMCVMSLRESTVVTQEFKLTEITVSQLSVNYFTHTHKMCEKRRRRHAKFWVHASLCTYTLAGECVCVCVMWFIPLVIALVAQARCQRLVVADLFTFVGWQEHEISSGCTAAGRPANSMALQVFCCSRYRLPRPRPPPSCGSLVLRVTPRKHKLIRILTRAHWSHENQPSCRVNAGKHEPAQTHLDILQLLHLRD